MIYMIKLTVHFQAYLEQQVEEHERVEQERMEERQIATKKILEMNKIEQANTIEGKFLTCMVQIRLKRTLI